MAITKRKVPRSENSDNNEVVKVVNKKNIRLKNTIITDDIRKYVIQHTGSEKALDLMTPLQIKKLRQSMNRLALGIHASIIQTCSINCPMHNRCPMVLMGNAPYEQDCILEIDLFQKHVKAYKEAVVEHAKTIGSDIDIENDKVVETLIGEIVEADIMEFRANEMIADLGMVDDIPTLISEERVYTRPEEAVALRIKDRAKKIRDKNLKQLISTPEMIQRMKGKKKNTNALTAIDETRKQVDDIVAAATVVEGVLINE